MFKVNCNMGAKTCKAVAFLKVLQWEEQSWQANSSRRLLGMTAGSFSPWEFALASEPRGAHHEGPALG